MNRVLTSFLIILTTFLHSSLTSRCYQCTSSRDWQDCDETMFEKECPSNADRCAKIKKTINYQGSKIINYDRKCYVKEACGDFCQRYREQGVDCIISCCEGDLCNAATVPVTSRVLLWTCLVLTVFEILSIVL